MKKKIVVKNNSIAIIGWEEGGAGQIHTWIEKANNCHISCFVNTDDEPVNIDPSKIDRDVSQFSYPKKDSFKDKPLINSFDWVKALLDLGINKVLVAIGDPFQRYKEIQKAKSEGITLINAIHPTALIMDDVILHDNVIVFQRAIIGYRSELFSGAFIESAHLSHHNVIRECATIDPGAVLGGNVTIGKCARVHIGVSIKNKIRVGDNAILGAGTVVIKDIPKNVTVVGVPGKIIKHHKLEII